MRTFGIALLFLASSLLAQNDMLRVAAEPVTGKRDQPIEAKLQVQLKPGLHVNSNAPKDPSLIPLKLTLDKGGFELVKVAFPTPTEEKYAFSEAPLSVFTGNFPIAVTMKAVNVPTGGIGMASGKLRYQACSETVCYPPKTADVRIPVQLR